MSHSLFEIQEFIRRVVALNFPDALWIRAEIADIKTSKGHHYLDLVQKEEESDTIVAQGQAVIWQAKYKLLQKKLGLELEAILQVGMEVLILARPEFHERFGLKLMLEDIDASYTLGKMAMQRREVLRRLQALNLLRKNSQHPLPSVIQKVAVLSSERAAGLQDFKEHLSSNAFGYKFQVTLMPVAVQGAHVEREMIEQLTTIAKQSANFDAVAIIRGGGAKLDLASFDSFEMAVVVANMPLPVLVGIGHDVDETVLDLVAHTSLKTPTAVADFLIHHNLEFESEVVAKISEVKNIALRTLRAQGLRIQNLVQLLDFQLSTQFRQQRQMLEFIDRELPISARRIMLEQRRSLENLQSVVSLLSPETALKRGFAIVASGNKPIDSVHELEIGGTVQVQLQDGIFSSTVNAIS